MHLLEFHTHVLIIIQEIPVFSNLTSLTFLRHQSCYVIKILLQFEVQSKY